MQGSPPRRSRRSPPRGGGPSLPFVPIFIGVIVLGFIIGAGLSLVGKRGTSDAVALATSSPPSTLAPVTPAPTEVPAPDPTDAPATPEPSSPARTANPATPRPAPTPTARAAATAAAADSVPATSEPASATATPQPRDTPSRAATVSGTVASTLPPGGPEPPPSDQTDSEFGKLAADVVRTYISAISHGNIPAAYGALGEAAPDNNANLPELGIIDGSTRIKHLETHGSNDAAAVDVDLQTSGGLYLAQYTVHRSPSGAAIIVQHTIVKP